MYVYEKFILMYSLIKSGGDIRICEARQPPLEEGANLSEKSNNKWRSNRIVRSTLSGLFIFVLFWVLKSGFDPSILTRRKEGTKWKNYYLLQNR